MIGLLISAGILGLVIAAFENGEFPGWIQMAICVLATLLPIAFLTALVPAGLFFVPLLAGAVCGGFAISATCGMGVKRASMATGVYLVIEVVRHLLFMFLFGE